MLKCADGSFYTGCAKDLEKRVNSHQAGTAAKYTRSRLPVELIYSELAEDRSGALKREYEIKQLTRSEKLELIKSQPF